MRGANASARWIAISPALFVLLWSSGFVASKYGLPYAEPLTFLLWRFVIVAAILVVVAWYWRAPWPTTATGWMHIAVAGLLVHAGYLAGVFGAIHRGLSAGEMAMVAGLQPVLMVVAAAVWLREAVRVRQWIGIALGLVGVWLVVRHRIGTTDDSAAFMLAFFALACITGGTLYQKRFCARMDLRSGGAIQFAASAVAVGALAPWFETMVIDWTLEFAVALAWLVGVLSLGAISLLYLLLRRGATATTASLFYLVPPVTAVLGFLLFDERLPGLAFLGMACIVAAVMLVQGVSPSGRISPAAVRKSQSRER